MGGVLTGPDATVVVAVLGLIGTLGAAAIGAGLLTRRIRKVERTATTVEERQATVIREVLPNGGSSMKDQLSRLDLRSEAMEARLSGHDDRLGRVERVTKETQAGVVLLLELAGIDTASLAEHPDGR